MVMKKYMVNVFRIDNHTTVKAYTTEGAKEKAVMIYGNDPNLRFEVEEVDNG